MSTPPTAAERSEFLRLRVRQSLTQPTKDRQSNVLKPKGAHSVLSLEPTYSNSQQDCAQNFILLFSEAMPSLHSQTLRVFSVNFTVDKSALDTFVRCNSHYETNYNYTKPKEVWIFSSSAHHHFKIKATQFSLATRECHAITDQSLGLCDWAFSN